MYGNFGKWENYVIVTGTVLPEGGAGKNQRSNHLNTAIIYKQFEKLHWCTLKLSDI